MVDKTRNQNSIACLYPKEQVQGLPQLPAGWPVAGGGGPGRLHSRQVAQRGLRSGHLPTRTALTRN